VTHGEGRVTAWSAVGEVEDGMIVEVGALAVSVTALVLQRVDAHGSGRREAARVRRALLALHEQLVDWHLTAQSTDAAVSSWIASGMPDDARLERVHRARSSQRLAASRPADRWYQTRTRARAASARWHRRRRHRKLERLLRTYAPELVTQLTSAVSARKDRLDLVNDELDRLRRRTDSARAARREQQRLVEATDQLARAADDLAAYIRATFPLDPQAG
jgi:hypothetical protein